MSAASGEQPLVCDAHCHPQLDPAHHTALLHVAADRLAVMGVHADDWDAVEQLHTMLPDKTVPAYGVHPWWAHLHASEADQQLVDIVEGRSEEVKAAAMNKLTGDGAALCPQAAWTAKLLQHLHRSPKSIVGEIGLDRAAVISGTYASTAFTHQLRLLEQQLQIAADLSKPVSIHCVRAHGHLLHLLMARTPQDCPPRIMMHSYGGSVDDIGKLLKLRNKIGDRFYFGFSAVINGRQRDKLLERIRAVPDDRLLLESDEVVVSRMDEALREIQEIVAEAKGWSLEKVVMVACENYQAFYAPCSS